LKKGNDFNKLNLKPDLGKRLQIFVD